MASTIPLAKPYTPGKLVFPVALSRKVDGVPVKIIISQTAGVISAEFVSRQGNALLSVEDLVCDFMEAYIKSGLPVPVTFVGEVYQRGNMDADFKETSGIVRRQYDQSDQLAIALFDTDTGLDYEHPGKFVHRKDDPFKYRLEFLMYLKQIKLHKWVTPIDQYTCTDLEKLESFAASHATAFPKAEGMVARSYTDEWAPGNRTWGYQKVVVDPIIDLRILRWEEGEGKNANAAGTLIASYKGTEIGIGPGKLSYKERAELWAGYIDGVPVENLNLIAQIKHKTDDSYDALRQPTFQCWRFDKDEPDA